VIRGTRHILPSPLFFPRPGRIDVELLPALAPAAELPPEKAAAELRQLTRQAILERVGEPDLLA
jgi:1-acyl-sn-glycerol-3-phosphate acyltransferase